ncbi:MAG: TonB-dependent receptor, partial [Gammaproteobacteria bacterium]|nr:TonB-dependent receptor [Gammaproteobacteria bacterium]
SNVSENLLLGGALRYENYPEYGNTLDGKIAARLQVGLNLAIRGAVSTGFRVPTAGQANLRNVTTEFNMGFLADIATLPPTNPIAQQKGAKALTPEESVNTTLGVVFDVGGVDVTVDYYRIEIEDRISLTSRFNLTPVEASGIDVVATWPFEMGGGLSNLTFAGNWQSVDLTKFNPDFTSDKRRLQIEQGRPDSRFTLTWTHSQGRWRLMARARYYGEYYDAPTNNGSVAFYPDPSMVFDAEIGVDATNSLSLQFGVQNAFDEYPSTNPNGEVAGLVYPEQSPFSFNGGFYYLRAAYRME